MPLLYSVMYGAMQSPGSLREVEGEQKQKCTPLNKVGCAGWTDTSSLGREEANIKETRENEGHKLIFE